MKFILNILTISCLYIATVWAQASHIGFPLEGDTLKFGTNITVQIVRPNSIEGSIEVGIAIALLGCPVSEEAVCPSPAGQLGDILYTGPFAPTLQQMGMIYENFTLTLPAATSFFGPGRAQLAVARLHLIGISSTMCP
ncbi:hypothetical protein MSAN_01787600 [Mycena sanguinolenta]|uniref:Uncharacterized protein n=1 Tax=Mycena sanguinolenta TaxID=230812 RepID=A0A8H6XXS5_9AGAR|nr:hypothetical protein MSAN_01787600 [Mycena sanguinolenta]